MPSIKCWTSCRLQITTPWRGSSSTSSGRDPRLFDSDHFYCADGSLSPVLFVMCIQLNGEVIIYSSV